MNAKYYPENIELQLIMRFAGWVDPNFLLMHDNFCPHVVRQVTDYLRAVDIDQSWPHPHWAFMEPSKNEGPKLKIPTSQPQSLDAVIEKWENIFQNSIESLIAWMRWRVNVIIASPLNDIESLPLHCLNILDFDCRFHISSILNNRIA